MIDNVLLVAIREFRQIASMRSFWITLLILPAALAVGPIAQRLLGGDETERVMLVDPNGREATAIARRIDLDHRRDVLAALSRYAQRNHLEAADPTAPWAAHDRIYTDADADVAAFERSGGLDAALARIRHLGRADLPTFDPPERDFELVAPPPGLAAAAPAALDARVKPLLKGDGHDEKLGKPIDYVVGIPRNFATSGAPVRIWAAERPGQRFLATIQDVLTQDLRTRYLEANGFEAEKARTVGSLAPAIAISTPPPGGGRERVLVRSIVPLLSAYILLMSLLMSGQWMLQGLVEERSNKLIETVLACISPDELLYGKLVGTVAVGLTMVLVWVCFAGVAAFATQGAIAEFLRPALAPLTSPGIVLAMIYFFVAGYLMMSMIFLAIGAMSDSLRDAQSYLTPVLLVVAMPFAVLAQAILQDRAGFGVEIMTWIPIYTPFTMLARLGVGVPLWETVGSALVLALFVGIEFVLLGRVFRASLLAAGQKPNIAGIGRMMMRQVD